MDARKHAWALALLAIFSVAARYQTPNFVVTAPTPEMAQQIGQAAEKYRRELARDWLGYVMPEWSKPCPVTVRIERGAGGVTTFNFANGEVFGWNMSIQGPLDQIIDSVLPHEITHTVFASHFRQPLPRWADEGGCTTVESPSERDKQRQMLVEFLRTGRGIAFPHMFRMKEYPRDVLPLYAQGHSLSTYLIGQKGKHEFMEFLADGLKSEDWATVMQQHYGYRGLAELQNQWLDWVSKGCPGMDYAETSIAMRMASGRIAANTGAANNDKTNGGKDGGRDSGLVYRGQSPDAGGTSRLAPVRTANAPLSDPRPTAAGASGANTANSNDMSRGNVQGPTALGSTALGSAASGSAASGDSQGWRVPTRPTEFSTAPNDAGSGRSAEVAAAPSGFTGQSSGGFTGPSRYERPGAVSAGNEFPGQHLPDMPAQAAPQRRPGGAPAAHVPTYPVYPQGQPTMMMPCFGGS